jgi:probable phosphoglycerate mutase
MPPLLYYIRHGETDWNREGRLQGQREIPINANGRAQARRSGEILRDLIAREPQTAPDFVASPLGRARETMELVRAALGLDPQSYRVDERLTEISFGRWEGFTIPERGASRPRRSRRADATNGASRRRAPKATLRCHGACAAGTTRLRATPSRSRMAACCAG